MYSTDKYCDIHTFADELYDVHPPKLLEYAPLEPK